MWEEKGYLSVPSCVFVGGENTDRGVVTHSADSYGVIDERDVRLGESLPTAQHLARARLLLNLISPGPYHFSDRFNRVPLDPSNWIHPFVFACPYCRAFRVTRMTLDRARLRRPRIAQYVRDELTGHLVVLECGGAKEDGERRRCPLFALLRWLRVNFLGAVTWDEGEAEMRSHFDAEHRCPTCSLLICRLPNVKKCRC